MSLDKNSIELIKSTFSLMEDNGLKITEQMYKTLFKQYPECQDLFIAAKNQPAKLAQTIILFIQEIDDLNGLKKKLAFIAQRHTQAQVKAIHYPMVADALILAMKQVLGEELFSEAIATAWTNGFIFLASELMLMESQIYAESYNKKVI